MPTIAVPITATSVIDPSDVYVSSFISFQVKYYACVKNRYLFELILWFLMILENKSLYKKVKIDWSDTVQKTLSEKCKIIRL